MHNKQAFDTENRHGYGHRMGGCGSGFRSRFGEAFSGGFRKHGWAENMRKRMAGHKAVNIAEEPDRYTLLLYAAGLEKELFSLSVSDDILTISYQPKAEEGKSGFIHEEYQPVHFKRSFQLNGKVLTDDITASYTDGVLKVTLPKDPEAQQPAQEIAVN